MTRDDMDALKPGDIINSTTTGEAYIVVGVSKDVLHAVRVVAIANPSLWEKHRGPIQTAGDFARSNGYNGLDLNRS